MYGTRTDKTRRGIAGFVVRRKYAKLATLFTQLKNFHPHPPPIVQRDDITDTGNTQAFGFGFGDGDRDKLSFHPLREVRRDAEGGEGEFLCAISFWAGPFAAATPCLITALPFNKMITLMFNIRATKRAFVLGFHFSTLHVNRDGNSTAMNQKTNQTMNQPPTRLILPRHFDGMQDISFIIFK